MGYMHEFMDAELDERAAQSAQSVVTYWGQGVTPTDGHESWTLDAVARMLAAIKGYRFAGAYDPERGYKGHVYFAAATDVPHQMYSESNASMEAIGEFNHADSEGFLRVLQVSARALAANGQVVPPAWAK